MEQKDNNDSCKKDNKLENEKHDKEWNKKALNYRDPELQCRGDSIK